MSECSGVSDHGGQGAKRQREAVAEDVASPLIPHVAVEPQKGDAIAQVRCEKKEPEREPNRPVVAEQLRVVVVRKGGVD